MSNLIQAIIFFFIGQTLAWFQLNSQFLSEWWQDKPVISAMVMGIPCSISFWYGWRLIWVDSESVWAARFIAQAVGGVVFGALTWTILGESMLNPKTLSCLFLALLILFIQIRY